MSNLLHSAKNSSISSAPTAEAEDCELLSHGSYTRVPIDLVRALLDDPLRTPAALHFVFYRMLRQQLRNGPFDPHPTLLRRELRMSRRQVDYAHEIIDERDVEIEAFPVAPYLVVPDRLIKQSTGVRGAKFVAFCATVLASAAPITPQTAAARIGVTSPAVVTRLSKKAQEHGLVSSHRGPHGKITLWRPNESAAPAMPKNEELMLKNEKLKGPAERQVFKNGSSFLGNIEEPQNLKVKESPQPPKGGERHFKDRSRKKRVSVVEAAIEAAEDLAGYIEALAPLTGAGFIDKTPPADRITRLKQFAAALKSEGADPIDVAFVALDFAKTKRFHPTLCETVAAVVKQQKLRKDREKAASKLADDPTIAELSWEPPYFTKQRLRSLGREEDAAKINSCADMVLVLNFEAQDYLASKGLSRQWLQDRLESEQRASHGLGEERRGKMLMEKIRDLVAASEAAEIAAQVEHDDLVQRKLDAVQRDALVAELGWRRPWDHAIALAIGRKEPVPDKNARLEFRYRGLFRELYFDEKSSKWLRQASFEKKLINHMRQNYSNVDVEGAALAEIIEKFASIDAM